MTKFPLVAGLFALVFAVGSLFGVSVLGAGVTAFAAAHSPRLTDFVYWFGWMSIFVVALAGYSWLLDKLGILQAAKDKQAAPGQKQEPDPPESAPGAVT